MHILYVFYNIRTCIFLSWSHPCNLLLVGSHVMYLRLQWAHRQVTIHLVGILYTMADTILAVLLVSLQQLVMITAPTALMHNLCMYIWHNVMYVICSMGTRRIVGWYAHPFSRCFFLIKHCNTSIAVGFTSSHQGPRLKHKANSTM